MLMISLHQQLISFTAFVIFVETEMYCQNWAASLPVLIFHWFSISINIIGHIEERYWTKYFSKTTSWENIFSSKQSMRCYSMFFFSDLKKKEKKMPVKFGSSSCDCREYREALCHFLLIFVAFFCRFQWQLAADASPLWRQLKIAGGLWTGLRRLFTGGRRNWFSKDSSLKPRRDNEAVPALLSRHK